MPAIGTPLPGVTPAPVVTCDMATLAQPKIKRNTVRPHIISNARNRPVPARLSAPVATRRVPRVSILKMWDKIFHKMRECAKLLNQMVGAEGFEPPTLCSQSRCATRLRYAPTPVDCIARSGGIRVIAIVVIGYAAIALMGLEFSGFSKNVGCGCLAMSWPSLLP